MTYIEFKKLLSGLKCLSKFKKNLKDNPYEPITPSELFRRYGKKSIDMAFEWLDTPEGFSYWSDINKIVRNIEH